MSRSLAAALALVLGSCTGVASSPPPAASLPAVAVPGFDLALIQKVVEALASDAFEGRAPGTVGEDKTVPYLIGQLQAAGLAPGNNGSWVQEVPTVEIAGDNFTGLVINGGSGPLRFAYGSDMVAGSYRVVPRTEIRDSELVFVGHGIVAPELGWNDYAGVDMRGKTAVILVNDPDYAEASEEGPFKGRRMTWYGRWPYKFEEAAKQGARAALIVHDTFPAAYGWNVAQSSWSGAQYYVQTPNDAMDQTEANGWIQKPAAAAILAAAGKDLEALSAAARRKGFRPVPLGLTASMAFDNKVKRTTSRNVVGLLRGTTRPDETVLYTAHWDHLGRCTARNGDDICNGAVDNATGVAALIALAKANAAAGPAERSQVFLAVTLEESGLLGSEWYARNPLYPLGRTAGGVNMDGLHPTGRTRDVQLIGGDKSELTGLLAGATTAMGLTVSPEPYPERGFYYRSDHFSLAKRGVPMFNIKRGLDMVEGGIAAGRAAEADYTDNRYHAPSDELTPQWRWDGILQDVAMLYRLGRGLAMSRAWPNWHPTDEFRKERDKTCSVRDAC